MHPIIVGASYRTVPSGVREKLYLDQAARADMLANLAERGIKQALIFSTCDRVEIMICSDNGEDDCATVQGLMAAHAGLTPGKAAEQLYRKYGNDAIEHFFTVICALDSHMIGEAQIFGQVKEAITETEQAGMTGPELQDLIQAATTLAKRVRTNTKIGEGAISVASAAVRVARDLHGNLERCRAMLLGLGETGLLLQEQFQLGGLDQWMMSGSSRRTERVAARLGAHYIPRDRWLDFIAQADVIVTSAGSGRFLIDREMAEMALELRRNQPMLILDCGIPSDVDPGIDELSDIFRYALSDIEQLAERGQHDRMDAAEEARAMVREAVGDFRRTLAEKDGIPMLLALRQHFEKTRESVLSDHPSANPEEATRLLVNRLLHHPSESLRALAAQGEAADFRDTITVNRVLEQMFELSIRGTMDDKSTSGDKPVEPGE